MAHILFERVINLHGIAWVRAHGYGIEGFALCGTAVHPGIENVTEGEGQITCPDCIEVIEACKAIAASDLAPEYNNELFYKRFERGPSAT